MREFIGTAALAAAKAAYDNPAKVQLALDDLLGVKVEDKSIRPFRTLTEAYQLISGDLDGSKLDRGGLYGRVSEAAVTTGDFANLLLNSMTKRALQDYAAARDGLEMLFSPVSVNDLKTQDRVREGYFADLAVVAEDGPYTEFAHPTDEKISYSLAKYGNKLTITEEAIINDDLRRITDWASKIGRAARRTLKAKITGYFVDNGNYTDGNAWFHATHANLGAAALAIDSLTAARVAMFKQTEKDSAKRLGLPLEWLMVPIELEATAYQINQNDTGANPWYHRFGLNNERIITNELLTDTNDWYVGSLPATAPFLEMAFLRGQQGPEIFLANSQSEGAMLTNDEVVYKVRTRFGGGMVDYRPVYKAVVA